MRWLPVGKVKHGPRFELRNTIIFNPGNNSGIFMPVDPFHIHIEGRDGLLIGRDDPLNPENPDEKVWEISDSEIYKRRCPRDFALAAMHSCTRPIVIGPVPGRMRCAQTGERLALNGLDGDE